MFAETCNAFSSKSIPQLRWFHYSQQSCKGAQGSFLVSKTTFLSLYLELWKMFHNIFLSIQKDYSIFLDHRQVLRALYIFGSVLLETNVCIHTIWSSNWVTKDGRSFSLFEFLHRTDLVHRSVRTSSSGKHSRSSLITRRAVIEKGGLHWTLYETYFLLDLNFG